MQIATAAIGGAQTIMQGYTAKGEADAQREVYQQERKQALISAATDEAARRSKLHGILASQSALLAGRGLDPFDEQSRTIGDASRADAEADIGLNKMGFLNKAERLGQQAAYAKWQGKSALTGAFISAGFQLLSGGLGQANAAAGGATAAGLNAAPGAGAPTAGV